MKHPADYRVYRILGNELPPRDQTGSRLKVLRFILQHEVDALKQRRAWIVNRIHDMSYLDQVLDLLDQHGESYKVIPFSPSHYQRCATRRARILYAVNINGARNCALALGQSLAQFSWILDGDCFFSGHAWSCCLEDIHRDQGRKTRLYYSIPMYRVPANRNLFDLDTTQLKVEEPQLAFRNDAELRFDEELAFGDDDKCELLWRLGHARDYRFRIQATPQCGTAGYVFHLSTGNRIVETDIQARGTARRISLDRLIHRLDAQTGAVSIAD